LEQGSLEKEIQGFFKDPILGDKEVDMADVSKKTKELGCELAIRRRKYKERRSGEGCKGFDRYGCLKTLNSKGDKIFPYKRRFSL